MKHIIPPETLAALGTLDTCAVANAIECFDVRLRNEGFTDSRVKCRLPNLPPMLGYARTLRVRSAAPSWKGGNYLDRTDWWPHLQNKPGPHVLVIQDMDRTPGVGAFVGEIHAAILTAFGAVGAVTNGAVRDLPAVERLGFRLFSNAVSVSHAYAHIVEIGGLVEIAGLRIADGDLLHGDQHGIVQIPWEIADKIPATAARIQERERRILEYCHSANFTMPGLKALATGSPCPPADPQNPSNPGTCSR